MSNYLDLEDKLLDDEDDQTPDDSISANGPIQDLRPQVSAPSRAAAGPAYDPKVAAAIAKRKIENPLTTSANQKLENASPLAQDPLLTQFDESQKKLDEYRKVKSDNDYLANMGQVASMLAQGVNKPQDTNSFYSNIEKQNKEKVAGQEEDISKRNKVMEAIAARQTRAGIAQAGFDTRQKLAELKGKDIALRRDEQTSAKNEGLLKKYRDEMDNLMDPNKARGGNMALNQKRIDNADRVQALLAQVHGNPDPRQMEELAISTQALLSSTGSPAAEQVKALIPKTAMGNVNAFREWLTNDPTGTGQQEFVKRMAETVDREKEVAQGQVQKAQRAHLPRFSKYKELDPEGYSAQLSGYGLSEESPGVSAQKEVKIGASLPVRMQAPDGSIRLVPADQVDAAVAARGKKL